MNTKRTDSQIKRQAAVAAGYAVSGASANARKLLKENKWVIDEVKRRKAAAELRARASASADLDELIRLLSDIARENFCSFFYEEDGRMQAKNGIACPRIRGGLSRDWTETACRFCTTSWTRYGCCLIFTENAETARRKRAAWWFCRRESDA